MNSFAERLETILRGRGMDVAGAARRCGVSKTRMYRFVNGVSEPTITIGLQMADGIGVSPEELLIGRRPPKLGNVGPDHIRRLADDTNALHRHLRELQLAMGGPEPQLEIEEGPPLLRDGEVLRLVGNETPAFPTVPVHLKVFTERELKMLDVADMQLCAAAGEPRLVDLRPGLRTNGRLMRVRADGDSMHPLFADGTDLVLERLPEPVLVEPVVGDKPRLRGIDLGQVYLIETGEGEWTVKRVWPSTWGVALSADNPNTGFGPVRFIEPGDRVFILAKLVGIVRPKRPSRGKRV